MEFSITCPIDGPVDVSLEDIETVVLRESEHADITFVCPHCGTQITVTAIVPSFLLAAMEALAEEPGETERTTFSVIAEPAVPEVEMNVEYEELDTGDPLYDAYCEYFRRQLSRVECVEDALHEIDSLA